MLALPSPSPNIRSVVDYGIIGFAAGLASAVGGAVKDSPYEGFSYLKFLRSPMVGAIAGITTGYFFPDIHPAVLFFACIGEERVVVESYKIARVQKPGKFRNGEWGKKKQKKRG